MAELSFDDLIPKTTAEPATFINRPPVASSARVVGDDEAVRRGLYEGAPQPSAAAGLSFDDLVPQQSQQSNFASRFGGMQQPANAAQLDIALRGARPTTPGQQLAIDFQNQGSAAGQRTTPNVQAQSKNFITSDVFVDDANNFTFTDPQTGQLTSVDKGKHIVLQDPVDGRTKVFARTDETTESPFSSAGRLMIQGLGTGAPTLRPNAAIAPMLRPSVSVRADAVKELQSEGVTAITAGQKKGSQALKYAESTLGNAIGGGGKAAAKQEKAAEQYTAAILRRAGIAGETRATPEVLNAAGERIGSTFDDIAARNKVIPLDAQFATDAEKVASDFQKLTNQRSSLLDDLISRAQTSSPQTVTLPPAGSRLSREEYQKLAKVIKSGGQGQSQISGETYQSLQSEIGRFRRAASSPELKIALGDLKDALDSVIERGLTNPKDLSLWKEARRQYKNLLVIENASAGGQEQAALGLISPAKLQQAVASVEGKRAYVRGRSDFAGLARAGKAIMTPLPSSGTAERAAAQFVPGLVASGIAGAYNRDAFDPSNLAAAFAPGLLGRGLLSRPAQWMLSPSARAGTNPLLDLMLRGGQVPGVVSNQPPGGR